MDSALETKISALYSSAEILMQLERRAGAAGFAEALCECADGSCIRVAKEKVSEYKTAWKEQFLGLKRDYRNSIVYNSDWRYKALELGNFESQFRTKLEALVGEMPTIVSIEYTTILLQQIQSRASQGLYWGDVELDDTLASLLGLTAVTTLSEVQNVLLARFVADIELRLAPTVYQRYTRHRRTKSPLKAAQMIYKGCSPLQLKRKHKKIYARYIHDELVEKIKAVAPNQQQSIRDANEK